MTTQLPPPFDADWRVVGTRTDSSRIALASVTAETTLYEHVPSADALSRLEPADVEVPLRSLFAIELSFSPSLSAVGVTPASGLELAAPKAKSRFVETLEEEGLAVGDQKRVGKLTREDGTEGRWYVLETAYPIASAHGEADAETDDRPTVVAETHVAVWPTDESFAVAGGVVPLEGVSGLEVDIERDQQRLLDVIRVLEIGEDDGDESADTDGAGSGEDDAVAGDGA